MSLIIEFLAWLVGCQIISIKLNQISILIIWGGQLVIIGIILVVEVCSIYFGV
jgi:hypothetical protein